MEKKDVLLFCLISDSGDGEGDEERREEREEGSKNRLGSTRSTVCVLEFSVARYSSMRRVLVNFTGLDRIVPGPLSVPVPVSCHAISARHILSYPIQMKHTFTFSLSSLPSSDTAPPPSTLSSHVPAPSPPLLHLLPTTHPRPVSAEMEAVPL